MNLKDELLALLAGTRIIRIDVKGDLKFAASNMNRLLRAVDENEDFYNVDNYANNTPNKMVKTYQQMQEEAFRIQKDMFITIKDLQLLDLTDGQILTILKDRGINKKLANNLISGIFTPVNYSKPRFEKKIKEVEAAMENLTDDNERYNYFANRDFLFPQSQLDQVKADYAGKYFFDETYNKETKEFEGGYYPERQSYKLNKNGTLQYDDKGNPIPERGFLGQTIEKTLDVIKELPSRFALPGQDLFGKASEKPLPITPMPNQQVVQTAQAPSITNQGLTATENAFFTEEEKAMRLKEKGLA